MLSGAVGAMFLATLHAQAAEPAAQWSFDKRGQAAPAVDGFNVKFDALGGTMGKKGFGGTRGVFTVPLGTSFGLQVDGLVGRFDGHYYGVGAGHLFWRNPSVALAGIYVDHTYLNRAGGVRANHVGAEGDLYFGRWTLGGRTGVEFGNSTSETVGSTIQTYDIKTRFFDKVDLSYYPLDNLKLSVGHRYLGGRHAAAFGAEWGIELPSTTMAAVFVEGTLGGSDSTGVWGGLRFYFGEHRKPLIERHRRDDPDPVNPDNLLTISNSAQTTSIPTTPPPQNNNE